MEVCISSRVAFDEQEDTLLKDNFFLNFEFKSEATGGLVSTEVPLVGAFVGVEELICLAHSTRDCHFGLA